MSLTYSQVTSLVYENVGANSTSFPASTLVLYANQAIDSLLLKLFGEGSGGTWTLDDSSNSDLPILYADIVSGTRTYNFTSDNAGNLILDIYKVYAKDSSAGTYKELTPVGYDDAPLSMDDGENETGLPTVYRKTGKAIQLDLIPNYNSTNGLKVLVSREGTYFLSTDTTKKWGYSGLWHEYIVLYICYSYARNKNLEVTERFKRDLLEIERKIVAHAGQRDHDTERIMNVMVEDNR